MKRRLLPCLVIGSALVLALALAACGGSGGSSDESQIEEAIETSATSADPANCTKLETLNFAEQGSETEGQEAVKECEKEVKDNAESVTVSKVEVEGSKATADAAVTGGGFDGQTVEIALVKEGDQWKLDEITGFAKLDQAKVVAALTEQFEESGEVEESVATCIEEGFEEASQPEIEELLLSGSPESIEELAEECS